MSIKDKEYQLIKNEITEIGKNIIEQAGLNFIGCIDQHSRRHIILSVNVPNIGIYNIDNGVPGHWITFAIVQNKQDHSFTFYVKDSLGRKNKEN